MPSDEPMSTTQLVPPTPRLAPGSLLGELEILQLERSDDHKNLYSGSLEDRTVLIVEASAHAGQLLVHECGSVMPELVDFIQHDERLYIVVEEPEGASLKDLVLPCVEHQLVTWLYDLIAFVDRIVALGVSPEFLHGDDFFMGEEGWQWLGLPIHGPVNGDASAQFIHDLIKRFLVRNIAPKITRDLSKPAASLSLSEELSDAVNAYMDGDVGLELFSAVLNRAVSSQGVRWDIAQRCHTGLVRDHNEDAACRTKLVYQTDQAAYDIELFAVADGMGGHSKGEVAAHLASSAWMTHLNLAFLPRSEPRFDNPNLAALMSDAFERAADEVLSLTRDKDQEHEASPGATLVAGLLLGRLLVLGNCGDSRAYRITSAGAERLTHDHSLVQIYVDRGQITEEEARDHVQSNVITSYMGIEPKSFRKDISVHALYPGHRLLLCSDGVHDLLDDKTIHKVVHGSPDADTACRRLVAAALEAGGRDNITALVVCEKAAVHATVAEEAL